MKNKSCMNILKLKFIVSHLIVSIKNILSVSECFILFEEKKDPILSVQTVDFDCKKNPLKKTMKIRALLLWSQYRHLSNELSRGVYTNLLDLIVFGFVSLLFK